MCVTKIKLCSCLAQLKGDGILGQSGLHATATTTAGMGREHDQDLAQIQMAWDAWGTQSKKGSAE